MQNLSELSVGDILGSHEENKQKGTRSLVLMILRQNPDGVSSKLIAEQVNISTVRARDILKELCYAREAYSRTIPGVKGKIYYPNGKLIHKYLQDSQEFGNQIFRLSFHEGKNKPRIQIQERKFTLLEGESVEGSVFVDIENAEHLIEFLSEMLNKFSIFDAGTGKEGVDLDANK